MLKNIKHFFLILIISFFSCDLDIEYVEVDDPEKIELDSINQVSIAVSYTHLTLPTTPYV